MRFVSGGYWQLYWLKDPIIDILQNACFFLQLKARLDEEAERV